MNKKSSLISFRGNSGALANLILDLTILPVYYRFKENANFRNVSTE